MTIYLNYSEFNSLLIGVSCLLISVNYFLVSVNYLLMSVNCSSSIDEVNYWNKEDSPVGRLGLYLMKRKLWDAEKENSYAKEVCCFVDTRWEFTNLIKSVKCFPYSYH